MGDEVFGVAPGCLGRSVVAAQQLLVPKPPCVSFEGAATTPTVYVTVFQAFGNLATFSSSSKVGVKPLLCCLCPACILHTCRSRADSAVMRGSPAFACSLLCDGGRKSLLAPQVLVHAGTGGVGLAAVIIATALKCPILATAGTPQKRALLRDLGVQAAASSRDTSFLDVMGYQYGAAGHQLLARFSLSHTHGFRGDRLSGLQLCCHPSDLLSANVKHIRLLICKLKISTHYAGGIRQAKIAIT